MKIALGGDVFLGGDLLNSPNEAPIKLSIFDDADIRIINLEQAVSNSGTAQNKSTLYTTSQALNVLKILDVDFVNIANNHIHDMGLSGINETITHLQKAGVSVFGAGKNLENAKKSVTLAEGFVLLGYCEFGQSYLSQVAVATPVLPGVSPLRLENILNDLDRLPDGKSAILYFHWGREHVYFPPHKDILLAKRLLDDERVALIVGMHSHLVQGYISNNGKRAYMGIGNLLFPNFHMAPRAQIIRLENNKFPIPSIRRYHAVYGLTYKKWKTSNRRSIVVEFDTESRKTRYCITKQNDNKPDVIFSSSITTRMLIRVLTLLYQLPKPLYLILEKLNIGCVKLSWAFHQGFFIVTQKGLVFFLQKLIFMCKNK